MKNVYRAARAGDLIVAPEEAKPIHRLSAVISSAWSRWMDPSCPACGHDKSCPECLIENNP